MRVTTERVQWLGGKWKSKAQLVIARKHKPFWLLSRYTKQKTVRHELLPLMWILFYQFVGVVKPGGEVIDSIFLIYHCLLNAVNKRSIVHLWKFVLSHHASFKAKLQIAFFFYTLSKIQFSSFNFICTQFSSLIFNFVQYNLHVTLCQNWAVNDLQNDIVCIEQN